MAKLLENQGPKITKALLRGLSPEVNLVFRSSLPDIASTTKSGNGMSYTKYVCCILVFNNNALR